MALSLLLGLICLWCESLWIDEVTSYWIAELDGARFFEVAYGFDAAMPLYYTVLHLWTTLGDSEWFIRLLSVFSSVAAVGAMYVLGKTLWGPRAGVIAATLLALLPRSVDSAQTARGYSLLMFLSIAATIAYIRALGDPTWKRWATYGGLGVLVVLTHPQGTFLLMAHALGAVPFIGTLGLRRALVVYLGVGLALAPAILRIGSGLDGFTAPTDAGQLSASALYLSGASALFMGIAVVLIILGFVDRSPTPVGGAWWQRFMPRWFLASDAHDQARSLAPAFPYALLVSGFAVPIVLLWVFGSVLPPFTPRYVTVSLPFLVLMIAAGLDAIRNVRVLLLTGVLLATQLAPPLFERYSTRTTEDWRSATKHILDNAEPGDGIVFFAPGVAPAFSYYAGERSSELRHIYPHEGWRTDDWSVRPRILASIFTPEGPFQDVDRLWLVKSHHRATSADDSRAADLPKLSRHLRTYYRGLKGAPTLSFNGIIVQLYEQRRKPLG
jgi:mannosyltransferase